MFNYKAWIGNGKRWINIGEAAGRNGWYDRYDKKSQAGQEFISQINIGHYQKNSHTDKIIHQILRNIGAKDQKMLKIKNGSDEVFDITTISKNEQISLAIIDYIIQAYYIQGLTQTTIETDIRLMKKKDLKLVSFIGREFNEEIINNWLKLKNKEIKGLFAYPRTGKSITTAYYFMKKGYKNIGIFSGKPSEIKAAWQNLPNIFIDFIGMNFKLISLQKLGVMAERDEDKLVKVIKEICNKNNFDAIAIDEFHFGMWHDKYTKELNSLGIEVVIITGTPYVPAEIFKSINEKNIATVSYEQLVNAKICVPTNHYYLEPKELIDLEKFNEENIGPFLNNLFDSQADFYRRLNAGILIVKNNKFAKKLTKYINENFENIYAEMISGGAKISGTLEQHMNEIIEEDRNRRVLFITCNKGLCGVSVAALNYLIWMTDQKDMSLNKFQQANARSTMVFPGKTMCYCFYLSQSLCIKACLKYNPKFGLNAKGIKELYINGEYEKAECNNLAFYDLRIGQFKKPCTDMEFKNLCAQYMKDIFTQEIYLERIQSVSLDLILDIDWSEITLDGKKSNVLKEEVFNTGGSIIKNISKKRGIRDEATKNEQEEKIIELKKMWAQDMLLLRTVLNEKKFNNLISNEKNRIAINNCYVKNKIELDDYYGEETIKSEKFVKILFNHFLTSQQRYYIPKDIFNQYFKITGKTATINLDFWIHNENITLVNLFNIWTQNEKDIIKIIYNIDIKENFMKFENIIMNPPYGSLHLPILKKMVEEVINKNNGQIISIQPDKFLLDVRAPYSKLLKKNYKENKEFFKNKIESVNTNIDLKSFGTGQFQELAIIKLSNKGKWHYDTLRNQKLGNFKELFNKIKDGNTIHQAIQNNKESKWFVGLTQTQGHIGQKDFYNIVSPNRIINQDSMNSNEGKMIRRIYFNTKNEAQNFLDSLKTTFMKFCNSLIKIDNVNDYQYLPYMENYSQPWTNERFYKHFNIIKKEQEIIEKIMREYE